MKTIKRILSIILIVAIAAVALVIWQGYEMYSDAVAKVSVEEKAAEIMKQDHYTTYEELQEQPGVILRARKLWRAAAL